MCRQFDSGLRHLLFLKQIILFSEELLFFRKHVTADLLLRGILAQVVEHLTFNQVVRGSSPRCLIEVRESFIERRPAGFFIAYFAVQTLLH